MKFSEFLLEEKQSFFKTREEVEGWLKKMRIKSYEIQDDLTVNVADPVKIEEQYIHFLPVKFGTVADSFTLINCQLKSLKGTPTYVGKFFNVAANDLQSLKFSPKSVAGYYNARNNKISSLKGVTENVKGNFYFQNNNLTDLSGCPATVFGLDCSNNKLTNLIGGPVKVSTIFTATDNKLTSIDGIPVFAEKIDLSNNPTLTSLKGLNKIKSCSKLNLPSNIRSNILGIMKIEDLKSSDVSFNFSYGDVEEQANLKAAWKIIEQFMSDKVDNDTIIKCQNALIEAGLREFGKF